MILLKNEKKPSVKIFKGKDIIFRIGLTTISITERTAPANRNVTNPPVILTPDRNCVRAKSETEWNTIFLIIALIILNPST